MAIFYGKNLVTIVDVDGTYIHVNSLPFPGVVGIGTETMLYAVNYTEIRDAEEAVALGIEGVTVPARIEREAAFDSVQDFREFVESLSQYCDGTFICLGDISEVIDDFPKNSIFQSQEYGRDIKAVCKTADGVREFTATTWAYNQPVGWAEAKQAHSEEVASFIDALLDASRAAIQRRKVAEIEKRKAELVAKFATTS